MLVQGSNSFELQSRLHMVSFKVLRAPLFASSLLLRLFLCIVQVEEVLQVPFDKADMLTLARTISLNTKKLSRGLGIESMANKVDAPPTAEDQSALKCDQCGGGVGTVGLHSYNSINVIKRASAALRLLHLQLQQRDGSTGMICERCSKDLQQRKSAYCCWNLKHDVCLSWITCCSSATA
jgi:hypothetical protein